MTVVEKGRDWNNANPRNSRSGSRIRVVQLLSATPDKLATEQPIHRGADKSRRARLEDSIREEFAGFKGQRLTKFFQGGSSSTSIDRLEGSEYAAPSATPQQVP